MSGLCLAYNQFVSMNFNGKYRQKRNGSYEMISYLIINHFISFTIGCKTVDLDSSASGGNKESLHPTNSIVTLHTKQPLCNSSHQYIVSHIKQKLYQMGNCPKLRKLCWTLFEVQHSCFFKDVPPKMLTQYLGQHIYQYYFIIIVEQFTLVLMVFCH